jgi:5-methylcytosine-specific restriction endonuclease McrA
VNKIIDDAEIIDAYQKTNSTYKVAIIFNTTRAKIRIILKKAGVLKTTSEYAKLRIGTKNPFFGKKHSIEVKAKLSAHAKLRTSKRNPNYRHGNYQRRPKDFRIAEFKPIRNYVFNRDNYKCCYCEEKGHLHAHHIIPYWVLNEAYLDTDNLVTVCSDCHFVYAHLGNWHKFDINLITETLVIRYKLDRERLTELTLQNRSDVIVRTSDINETDEIARNDAVLLDKNPSNNK